MEITQANFIYAFLKRSVKVNKAEGIPDRFHISHSNGSVGIPRRVSGACFYISNRQWILSQYPSFSLFPYDPLPRREFLRVRAENI